MRGRPVLGVIAGFLFGLCLAATLVFAGVLALNSVLVIVLPFLGIAYGLVMAKVAPFHRGPPAPAEQPPPAPSD